ncbi:bifunctional pyr operon transcriptional regulator/uracil phosphoribosyltransferase PyrR [Psychroflexus maritimus]|uniref:Bifunctional pyr operon transcriptional regulator/uracil phosphoribosyltransferase PyrR n=1 Tax=Psychroflexus maritimus TaxID=2714865 RepID=A0A967ACG5_9FLAO|nr:bifunctional pyr operon transcriptional regulator/uracil phosphoribosyltransferase PyrR [Psychroflexus maritimus]NGZ89063.1 bifunctional pyr operon transcriptional regulator/uracil phosphoribosyltransferase PyrR [Psychroflexus maritimus]
MSQKQLLNSSEMTVTLQRLACQLVENHTTFQNSVLIGLQPRGVALAERLVEILKNDYDLTDVEFGKLDITFYRDDFRRSGKVLEANTTEIPFVVDGKRVIFIDDVLYTGRSINSALTALQSFGRPLEVELLCLIDRRFSRHLPIQPDYVGKHVDVINEEKVKVNWSEDNKENSVILIDE